MNNFIFDEMNAAEYRADRIAEAKEYRRITRSPENRILVSLYRTLSTFGGLLASWGTRMQARFDRLAYPDKCEMLPHPAK